ncbi:MAG: CCA tRNA nucleotidyltransferase [Chloroflexi bacterium]|nr:CCA tRNA nucleotidyltransferase [Chloroflexota bacterium]
MPRAGELRARLAASVPGPIAAFLAQAVRLARERHLPLYAAGGAVRDLLLGLAIPELDLVVEGDAGAYGLALAEASGAQVVARSQFGTVKLALTDHRVDIATARSETYRRPGALPTVRPATTLEDLRRRDFTINAMALRLVPAPARLLDPTGGQGDMAARLVRVLHAASFQDDATRILRAIRYEQRLSFRLEPQTLTLLRRDLSFLDTISPDRLRRELSLVFNEPHAPQALTRAAELGVLAAIQPVLPDSRALGDALALLAGSGFPLRPPHYLGVLAFGLGVSPPAVGRPGPVEGLILRLNLPPRQAKLVRDTVALRHDAPALAQETSPAAVYRRLRGYALEAVQVVAALATGEARRHLLRYVDEDRHVRPLLTGDDLARLGVPQGPRVGALLEALRDARLDGQLHTREQEEAFVRQHLQRP